jgi:hypothetical protein
MNDQWRYLMAMYTGDERMTFAEWKERDSLAAEIAPFTDEDEEWLAKHGMTYEGGSK